MTQSIAILRLYHISAWDGSSWKVGFHHLSDAEWGRCTMGLYSARSLNSSHTGHEDGERVRHEDSASAPTIPNPAPVPTLESLF